MKRRFSMLWQVSALFSYFFILCGGSVAPVSREMRAEEILRQEGARGDYGRSFIIEQVIIQDSPGEAMQSELVKLVFPYQGLFLNRQELADIFARIRSFMSEVSGHSLTASCSLESGVLVISIHP